MIVLPPGFVKTRYDGYFWNIPEKRLYSVKVSGVLKPMKHKQAYMLSPAGYSVSVNGFKKTLSDDYLASLKYPNEIEIFPKKG